MTNLENISENNLSTSIFRKCKVSKWISRLYNVSESYDGGYSGKSIIFTFLIRAILEIMDNF